MGARHARPARRLRILQLLVTLATLLLPAVAHAYPWMIRHGYTACAMCHFDPAGGGMPTEYGRALGDQYLRTPFGRKSADEEAGPTAGFLWGAVKTPEWLLLGGTFRSLLLRTGVEGAPASTTYTLMQSDLKAAIDTKALKAYASLGYQRNGARLAAITRSTQNNLVSREHWLGLAFSEETLLLRAGRMNLPYGLRSIEHTMWTRTATRTDINDRQQHGVAFSYSGEKLRGEVMGILGNFQMGPDDYRERGYSAYAEYAPWPVAAVGVSSLFTTAKRDLVGLLTTRRFANGVFARFVPAKPLVIMLEADLLLDKLVAESIHGGSATMLTLDYEIVQGLHAMVTGETLHEPKVGAGNSYGAWGSLAWFFAPHLDMRLDGIHEWRASTDGTHLGVSSLLAQFHAYL